MFLSFLQYISLVAVAGYNGVRASPILPQEQVAKRDAQVLILGGGVAGVIAARTLHEKGIDNFKIVEARSELGGRLQSFTFGPLGKEYTLELGANWIQGTQVGNGLENPIYKLAIKHNLSTAPSDYYGSMSELADNRFISKIR